MCIKRQIDNHEPACFLLGKEYNVTTCLRKAHQHP
jgi:hypothetical protein